MRFWSNASPRVFLGVHRVRCLWAVASAAGDIRRLSTKVLVILHPPTQEAEEAIEAIRKEYCAAFNQLSVLRSTTPALVSF